MITRRDVLLGGSSALMLPLMGRASPVNSMLAAREAKYIDDSATWENPYVTDGLLAHWDGEWNAGGGIHDPNELVWRDVVGGVPLTLLKMSDGYVEVNDMCYSTTHAGFYTNLTYLPTLLKGDATFRFIIQPKVYNRNGGEISLGYNGVWTTGWRGINLDQYKNNRFQMYLFDSTMRDCGPIRTNFTQITIVVKNGTSFKFINGHDYSSEYSFTGTQHASTMVGFGVTRKVAEDVSNNYLALCQVYSRILSDEELDYNLSVDTERFGL